MKKKSLLFFAIFSISILSLSSQKIIHSTSFVINSTSLKTDIQDVQTIQLGTTSITAKLVKNNLLSDEMKSKLSYIQTYDLVSKEGETFGNMVISPVGTWLNYWENNKFLIVVPNLNTEDSFDHYFDDKSESTPTVCDYNGVMEGLQDKEQEIITPKLRGNQRNGKMKRSYRIAIACTGEFYALNGNTNSSVNSVIVSSVAGLSAIYQRELSIQFVISGTKLYPNKNTDPFDPNSAENRTIQAGKAVAANFSSSSYDIGHALHQSEPDDGWVTGGVARLSAVCRNNMDFGSPVKAKGWSGSSKNIGYSWYSLFAHEIGHMFSANHTFNGTGESCTDAISDSNAYEIGSGNTIMSYNGICNELQNIPDFEEEDNYFHIASLLSIVNHAETIGDCSSNTQTNNNIPDITANPCGSVVNIPKSTPFVLKGSGTDADDDPIYYSWEQFDEDGPGTPTQGFIGTTAGNSAVAPLFKCFPPSITKNERFFPDLMTLADGPVSDKFQVLPRRSRTINFKLVGRDLKVEAGAFGYDDLVVNVVNSGPLTLLSPNNGTYDVGDMMEVTWDPNGSEDICTNATIKLSLNGGLGYDIVLKKDVDYDSGSTMVQIPPHLTSSSKSRVMITCSDSDCAQFFDISNGDFTINSDCDADINFICPSDDISFEQGDLGLNLDLSYISGDEISLVIKQMTNNTQDITIYDVNSNGCHIIFDYYTNEQNISVSEDGSYSFTVEDHYLDDPGFISIFNSNYNSNNTCASFIASSAIYAGNDNFLTATSNMTVELEACKEYKLIFYTYGDLSSRTKITSITGPGKVVALKDAPDFSYGYFAVNNSTGIIQAFSPDADFTTISGGEYSIYGIQYETGGANPTDMNDYIGQAYLSFYQEGDCFRACSNPLQLTVEATCLLTQVAIGTSTACDPIDNSFIQNIIVSFSELPTTGTIFINGQSYNIDETPLTIEISTQSNGEEVDLEVYYSEEPECIINTSFLQKMNCCEFEIPFDDSKVICPGETIIIDAGDGGNGGGTFEWFDSDNMTIMGAGKEINITTEGVYRVEVTSASGCKKEKSIEISISSLPNVQLPFDFNICENDAVNLIAVSDAVRFKWYKDDVLLQNDTTINLPINSGGQYILIGSNINNCSVTDTINITQSDAPEVALGDDKTSCIGNEELFIAPSGDFTYEWYIDNELYTDNDSLIITETSTLGLAVTDTNMCRGYDEIIITFEPGPTLLLDNSMIQICEGEEFIINATTDASSIKWLKGDDLLTGETGFSLTVTETAIYTAIVEGESGCIVEKRATVFVNPNPVLDLQSSLLGCEGEDLALSSNISANKYEWFDSANMLIGDTKSIDVNIPGEYRLKVTNEFDCTDEATISVTFTTKPTLTLPEVLNICEGESKELIATTNGNNFQWKKDDEDIEGETGKSINISTAGVYTLVSFSSPTCFEEFSTVVGIREKPVIDISGDYKLCPGEEVVIDANNSGSSFIWSTGETTQSITISHPDNIIAETTNTITVSVTNEFTCTNSGEADILLYPNINAQIDGDMGVCIGDTTTLTATGGQEFLWTGTNISSTNGATVQVYPTETTNYSVEVTDLLCSGQTETTDFEVEVYLPEEVTGGNDKKVILGKDVKLKASGGVSYQWSPDSTIVNGQGTATPTVNPTIETKYIVRITDINGCESIDTVLVTIVEDPLSLLKHVTVITPNDDGLNDELEFLGLEAFPKNSLTIYNRWGNIVFQTVDYQSTGNLFNGTRNGQELPADTYFYVLKFDEYVVKERLTIVRPK